MKLAVGLTQDEKDGHRVKNDIKTETPGGGEKVSIGKKQETSHEKIHFDVWSAQCDQKPCKYDNTFIPRLKMLFI